MSEGRSEAAAAYLRRIGVDGDLPPTLDTLVVVHRAHLDAVPYENLGIMLGRPPSVFHQNGAFGTVLTELGFDVSRRHGHVYTAEEGREDTSLNHLVLVVDGLPTDANPGGRWWADVGLGDAFRDPLPVLADHYDQAGFRDRAGVVRRVAGGAGRRHPAHPGRSRRRRAAGAVRRPVGQARSVDGGRTAVRGSSGAKPRRDLLVNGRLKESAHG